MNTFGTIFRVSLFGESHGDCVGVIIDGLPPGVSVNQADFINDLDRRRAGAVGTTTRVEEDIPHICSGYFNKVTTGAPLTVLFKNKDVQSDSYQGITSLPRPGHADWVAHEKFKGFQDYRGGGHFSGRLTLPLVAAGVLAKKILNKYNIAIEATLTEAHGNKDIAQALSNAMHKQDTIGGIVTCHVTGLPVGLGEPFFNSTESLLSHALFSIPAIKGVEFGDGFQATQKYGSAHNDVFIDAQGNTKTNHAGGIVGGLTNGQVVYFRVAVKPTSSTPQIQETFNFAKGTMDTIQVKGRHDYCIALRVPPIVEAVTAIVLLDLLYIQKAKS
ncbi:MAG: chorismate synthase [Phycisphaerales bacterium]|nr:chorismate synthase [Phycisphaerales bacterium]